MKIVSFDPGGTTGVAIWEDALTVEGTWERFELKGDHHYALWSLLINCEADIVVYERFNYQRRDITKGVSLRLDSVEYIGIIKLAHQRAGYWGHPFELVEQQPSLRTWWTDERLRKLGLWVSSEHERDATRHLLRYVTQVKKDKRFVEALR